MAINFQYYTGRVVADPELRYTNSGKAVANLRIAENDNTYNEQTREWEKKNSLFLTVNAWEKLGEAAALIPKGQSILVYGKLTTREYQDRDGNNRSSTELTAKDIRLTSPLPKPDQAGAGGTPAGTQQPNTDPWAGTPTGGNTGATGGFTGGAADDEPPF